MSGSNLLFIVTGSVAAYKACDAISRLVQRGHRVRVVATESALRFVGAATFEGLTGAAVARDLFAPGEALAHIELARWADATVVWPATANTLNRLAAGLADDLAGALVLAQDRSKPLLLAPAMNPAMWAHPATMAAGRTLTGWGARWIEPGTGRTACGEHGAGRLAEPADIVAAVEAATARPARRLRVLVTSGGTAEPIDAVRAITNTSTGETGALIAEHFARGGHAVRLLRARTARAAHGAEAETTFFTTAELATALAAELRAQEFDAVIHAAAVADFAVAAIESETGADLGPGGARGKLASGAAPVLRLKANPKLLETIRGLSRRRDVGVVGFKLTSGATAAESGAAVRALFAGGAVDLVVHNDLAQRAEGGAFPARLWADGEPAEWCEDRGAIGAALERRLLARGG